MYYILYARNAMRLIVLFRIDIFIVMLKLHYE